MATFALAVPGYAAIPSPYGPDVFAELGPWASGVVNTWSDQQGLRSGTDVEFAGRSERVVDFHFPFTVPVFFGTTSPDFATRLRVTAVFVTFFLRPTLDGTTTRVNRIRVFDRLATLFDTQPSLGPLNLPNMTTEAETTFSNTTFFERNLHVFAPRPIIKSIGVTVTVAFNAGGRIGFTGAGLRLE